MRDEHCHILWGVDDGSSSVEETTEMLHAACNVGIDYIVCTPHVRWSDFDAKKVLCHYEQFKKLANDTGIKTELGFELYFPILLDLGIDAAKHFVRQETNELLVEFNTGGQCTYGWQRLFYKLQIDYGIDITVAHPERYSTVQENFDTVYKMKEIGCRIQVSAGDLFFGRFNKMSKCAKRIIKEGLCDCVVSDAHCAQDYNDFKRAQEKFR